MISWKSHICATLIYSPHKTRGPRASVGAAESGEPPHVSNSALVLINQEAVLLQQKLDIGRSNNSNHAQCSVWIDLMFAGATGLL